MVAAATNTFRNGLIGEIGMAKAAFKSSPAELDRHLSNATTNTTVNISAFLYVASGIRDIDQRFCINQLVELFEASNHPFPEALRLSEEVENRVQKENARFAHGLKIISAMLLPALDRSLKKQAEGVAALQTARVGCAVQRHRLAHAGHLPETLAELVPTFLEAVPLDPFDGQPLRYRHTNDLYVVYSVGPDGEDQDGGMKEFARQKTAWRGDDIAFPVSGLNP